MTMMAPVYHTNTTTLICKLNKPIVVDIFWNVAPLGMTDNNNHNMDLMAMYLCVWCITDRFSIITISSLSNIVA